MSGHPGAPPAADRRLKVSAVVTSRDTREVTLRCLASLAREGPEGPDEVVLVDDGSRDGTAEAVEALHPRVRVLPLTPSRGFTAAATHGLATARGDLLWLLNSDTEVPAGATSRLRAAFAARARLGAASPALRYPDGRPQWTGGPAPTAAWLFVLASGAGEALARIPSYRRLRAPAGSGGGPVAWVTGAALAIRREAWSAVGGFDQRFRLYGQDLDLCLRLADAGWEVRVLDDIQVIHHGAVTIGQTPGAIPGRHHPGQLWADLVRWVDKRRGPAAAARAAGTLRLGGRLRLALRSGLALLPRHREDDAWRRETAALRAALASLPPR